MEGGTDVGATTGEPEKEICCLTRRDPNEDEVQNMAVVNGYAFATLGVVDHFFLKIRYALNSLDRAHVSGRGTRAAHLGQGTRETTGGQVGRVPPIQSGPCPSVARPVALGLQLVPRLGLIAYPLDLESVTPGSNSRRA